MAGQESNGASIWNCSRGAGSRKDTDCGVDGPTPQLNKLTGFLKSIVRKITGFIGPACKPKLARISEHTHFPGRLSMRRTINELITNFNRSKKSVQKIGPKCKKLHKELRF